MLSLIKTKSVYAQNDFLPKVSEDVCIDSLILLLVLSDSRVPGYIGISSLGGINRIGRERY